MKPKLQRIEMKAITQHFPLVLFDLLYRVHGSYL